MAGWSAHESGTKQVGEIMKLRLTLRFGKQSAASAFDPHGKDVVVRGIVKASISFSVAVGLTRVVECGLVSERSNC